MDEWMNGWMDEWMDGWMDWMDGWMDAFRRIADMACQARASICSSGAREGTDSQ
jgi:hypothetical protein